MQHWFVFCLLALGIVLIIAGPYIVPENIFGITLVGITLYRLLILLIVAIILIMSYVFSIRTINPQAAKLRNPSTWEKLFPKVDPPFGSLKWPELALLILIAGVVFSFALPQTPPSDADILLSIPVDKFIGGTDPLYPGRALELQAFVPGTNGTTETHIFSNLKVLELHRGETNTVLLIVPPASVLELETALANEKARFTYHFSNAPQIPPLPPTATPTVTLTATPVVTLTSTPTTTPTTTLTTIPTSTS